MLVHIGKGNKVNALEIIAIMNSNSREAKRKIKEAKDKNLLIDATEGAKSCSIIIIKNGNVILSINEPGTITNRCNIL